MDVDDETMVAEVIKLGELIKGSNAFKIPFFQRSYVWGEDEWERFLDDMQTISEAKKDYFMGAIILKSSGVSRMNVLRNERLIIDGQQRLTTILLFLKAVGWQGVERYLISKNNNLILEHNYNDRDIFDKVIKDSLSGSFKEKHKKNKVLQCYQYFKGHFEAEESKIKNIDIDAILEHKTFICISLGPSQDEQQIFDTMNSLGVVLRTGELLKNELYKENDEELYEKTWKKSFENDEEQKEFWDREFGTGKYSRSHLDMLLYTYLLVKSEKYATGGYKRMDMLFKNYRYALKNEFKECKKTFIYDLIGYAKKYEANINEKHNEKELNDGSVIQRLNIITFGLKITTVIPYILYILKEVDDEREQKKIFKLLETYLIRRAVAGMDSEGYNLYFLQHISRKRNTYESLRESLYKSDEGAWYMPSDEELKKAIANKKISNIVAKIALYFLEYYARDEQSATQLLPISEYNVEHVMPKKWEKHWLDSLLEDSPENREKRKESILTLGNLTILTPKLNSGIGNLGWEEKRDGPLTKKGIRKRGLKSCCDGITTISFFFDRNVWDEEVIKGRGEYLFNLAKDLWPYDPPKQF